VGETTAKKQMKKYYAAGCIKYAFYVPYRDEDGKTIPRRGVDGGIQYQNGQMVLQQKQCFFRAEVISPKLGFLASYATGVDPSISEKDEIEVLEKLVASPATPVMNQEQHDAKYRAKEVAVERAKRAEQERDEWKRKADAVEVELAKLKAKGGAAQPAQRPAGGSSLTIGSGKR